jgi:hypothetical protein
MAEKTARPVGRPKAKEDRQVLTVAVSRGTYDDMMDVLEAKGYIMRSFVERAIRAEIEREREHD